MDRIQARDEMLSALHQALQDNATGAVGYIPQVVYEDVGDPEAMPQDKAWLRAAVRHNSGRQRSLGETGGRRFERVGIVLVQLFVPRGAERVTIEDKLAKIATDAFEGKHTLGGVWFRAVRASEVGPDGPWNQTNIVAEFTYDELK